jgi:hypothetical protein
VRISEDCKGKDVQKKEAIAVAKASMIAFVRARIVLLLASPRQDLHSTAKHGSQLCENAVDASYTHNRRTHSDVRLILLVNFANELPFVLTGFPRRGKLATPRRLIAHTGTS